jgi:hypothetical protein
MWWKYCDDIVPPNQTLKRLNNVSLHQTFHDSLNDFLCTDSDGNLSITMNPDCDPKFTEYFSELFKGMSETQLWVQIFKRTIENSTFKKAFIDHMKKPVVLGTMILLSIFTIFFTPKVRKAFNVRIDAINYAALIYSNEDRTKWIFPFPWEYGLLHFKVFQMWKKHFSSWFN